MWYEAGGYPDNSRSLERQRLPERRLLTLQHEDEDREALKSGLLSQVSGL